MTLFFFGVMLGLIVWWAWCLIDAIQAQFEQPNDKVVWVLIILLTPFVGAVLYTLIGQHRKLNL